jgi:hypothetical protein
VLLPHKNQSGARSPCAGHCATVAALNDKAGIGRNRQSGALGGVRGGSGAANIEDRIAEWERAGLRRPAVGAEAAGSPSEQPSGIVH